MCSSLGTSSCLGAGMEMVNGRFTVRVFLEINHEGRKTKEVGGFFKRVIMVANHGIQAG